MANNAEKAPDTAQGKDAELEDLLDSALEDFDRQQPSTDAKVTSDAESAGAAQADKLEDIWTEDAMKEALLEFQKNVKVMCKAYRGESSEDVQLAEQLSQDFCKKATETMSSVFEGTKDKADWDETMKEMLNNLADNSKDLQDGASNQEDLMAMLSGLDLGQDDSELSPDIFSYCSKIVQMFLSKDTLYEPLKELCDKYPNWLEANKTKLSDDEHAKYTSQLRLMQKVCAEFETMSDSDSDDVKSEKHKKVLKLMQEMQDYGYPPEELMSAANSTMNISNDMMPGLMAGLMSGDVPPTGAPPGECSLM